MKSSNRQTQSETALRSAIVAEARSWVGTPFAHQAATKGAGCDCVGLVRGVAAALDISPIERWQWDAIGYYGRLPRPDIMGATLEKFLRKCDDPLPGDVAWIEWKRNLPMHLAFIGIDDTGRRTLIHSYSLVDRVVEHGFVEPWPGRVASFWRFPALLELATSKATGIRRHRQK